MADDRSASFESSLQRLEQIVKSLETEEPDLERAVLLYAEGKELVQRCEGLLKNAQQAIDAVNAPSAPSRPAEDALDDDEIPF
jgi:exodeoxyribonuclease VII small subunit